MAGDIQAPHRQWVDVYGLSGIAVGAGMLVQNKGLPVLVLEAAAQPAASSEEGFYLVSGQAIEIAAGSPGVWIQALSGSSRLFVQEA